MRATADIVPPDFRKWAGLRPHYEDQLQRAIQMSFTLINECLAGPSTPFGTMSRNGLLLNGQTRSYLYDGDYGFVDSSYEPGRSPMVERWIDAHIDTSMSDGEKVIALSQSLTYELPKAYPPPPAFLYGESDEQTLLKGGGHCSCKGKLLTAMCQMIGLQARPAMMWPWKDDSVDPPVFRSGHTVAEVYIDGRWGFFDPQHHIYCQTSEGYFPSIAEIRDRPELFTDMPDEVQAAMHPFVDYSDRPADKTFFQWYCYKNFHAKCMTQISRYDGMSIYEIKWTWATDSFRERQRKDYERYKNLLYQMADRNELTDEVYALGLDALLDFLNISDANLKSQAQGTAVAN